MNDSKDIKNIKKNTRTERNYVMPKKAAEDKNIAFYGEQLKIKVASLEGERESCTHIKLKKL